MRTLRDSPPSRLAAGERDLLREMADTLLFALRFDADVTQTLADVRALLLSLRSGPFDRWVDGLAEDLEACAPEPRNGVRTPVAPAPTALTGSAPADSTA